ncbi:MAG: helix-turn-helix transcriptional regulator [Acidobacteriota bacterium]
MDVVGFLLRLSREEAGLSQAQMADRLGCSQQAVSQAERWESNPTVRFLQSWTEALDLELVIDFAVRQAPSR